MNLVGMSSHHPISRVRFVTGSLLFLASIQYYVVEFIVQRAWSPVPYTLRFNTISDLGATACGPIPIIGTFACSPLHLLMNISFILTGLLALAGLMLLRPYFPKHWTVTIGMTFIALASLGSVGVGLFPENEHIVLHLISALTLFVLGNVGLLITGLSLYFLSFRPKLGLAASVLGTAGLSSFFLLPTGLLPAIGIGVLERFVAYPVTLWLILCGFVFLRHPGAAITDKA